jgi:succinate dehydrogenase / fumarate reductase flavoprotein subunit
MIIMAEAILKGARLRDESRGAHYKPDFPDRDDARFLQATIATYDSASDAPQITYGPVDTSLVTPRARTYGKKAEDAAAKSSATPAAAPTPATVSI